MNFLENISQINDEDILAYQKNGVVCLRNIITEKEIEHLRRDVNEQRLWKGNGHSAYDLEDMAMQLWKEGGVTDVGQSDRFDLAQLDYILESDTLSRPIRDETIGDDKGEFFYGAGAWLFQKGVRQVALDSALPAIMARLMDSIYVNFWEDNTFVKAPNTGQRTAFHQDLGYFHITGKKCCIVWIPLDKVTQKNGGMQYIKGSHKWGRTFAPNPFISQSPEPLSEHERLPDIEGSMSEYDILSFYVEPGDVIIHDVLTVHGAGGNGSLTESRRAVSFRYCGDDVRYYDRPGALPQPYFQGMELEDGDDLLCNDYPLVWPRPHPLAKISNHWPYLSVKNSTNQTIIEAETLAGRSAVEKARMATPIEKSINI